MLHILGVDEDLERTALAIDNGVIDGDIDSVGAFWPFDLVGGAAQLFGPVKKGAVRRFRRGCGLFLSEGQDRARHRIGPIGGHTLAAQRIAILIDRGEVFKGNVFGAIDGLGDGGVDIALSQSLHLQMISRAQGLGGDKGRFRRGGVAMQPPPGAEGIVFDRLFASGAVALTHLAIIAEGEDRLDAGRDIARQKRGGSGRRDGGQTAVAQSVPADGLAGLFIQRQ